MSEWYFRELLTKQPFEPFVLHLSSGEVYSIRHPECLALTKTRLVITDPVLDKITVCSMPRVTSVEVQLTAGPMPA
jgi:hypothetical protein